MLKFLWETINLGFWNTKENIKLILTYLLQILAKGERISYEDALIESKENKVMIDCKIQCLNIIELIANIDNDILVQNIAAKFKTLEFPPKHFNLKSMLANNSIM